MDRPSYEKRQLETRENGEGSELAQSIQSLGNYCFKTGGEVRRNFKIIRP